MKNLPGAYPLGVVAHQDDVTRCQFTLEAGEYLLFEGRGQRRSELPIDTKDLLGVTVMGAAHIAVASE